MSNLTSVGITSGLGTSGTGTISTLDNLLGTAGTASAQVQTVQGVASMTPISIASSGTAITNTAGALDINVKSGGNANGRAVPGSSAPVVLASQTYQDVAASQTATVLGSTGATGDWLEGITIIPETTAAGTVALIDSSTSVNIFVAGTLTSLVPFFVPLPALSKNGAWKITTGANVHIRAFGNFT